MPDLRLFASALVIWMPVGSSPDMQRLDRSLLVGSPQPNPEPWWLLHEAITHCMTVGGDHGKQPWIKTGDLILDPGQIAEVFSRMGDLKHLSSDS